MVDVLTRKVIRIDFPANRIKSKLDPQSNENQDLNDQSEIIKNDSNQFKMSSGSTAPNHLRSGSKIQHALQNGLDPETISKALLDSGRDRIKPSMTRFEYLPDLRLKSIQSNSGPEHIQSPSNCACSDSVNGVIETDHHKASEPDLDPHSTRPVLRPLHVIQPEGPSFT